MANIYTSADQLIGKTPLLELTHIEHTEKLEARILARIREKLAERKAAAAGLPPQQPAAPAATEPKADAEKQ